MKAVKAVIVVNTTDIIANIDDKNATKYFLLWSTYYI